ncbi:MAG: UDP-glucuronosyltransferase [Nitrosopumilaceae archaeon]|nr:UDP-glucuronosyltransferase [Nitrosopumilaceae archaeon]
MILFFTSPIGLGHASRDAAVAAHLDDVRFVTGGPATALLEGNGFAADDMYRPPSFEVRSGRLARQALWMVRYYRYYRRCKGVAGRIIRECDPDIVVADEDFAALAAATSLTGATPRVLITDILESRFLGGPAGMVERKMNGAMRRMMDGCNTVMMPQDGPDRSNLRMVGPIVRDITEDRHTLRERFGMTGKTVLVTVGGTAAGRFLLDAMKPVAERLRGTADTAILPGPALGDGIIHDLHQRVMAADVVVSLAGRSTMDEAAAYGTPGVFIPISGHFEQEDNAARLGYAHDDVHRLYDIILEKLAEPRHPRPAEGARRAAAIIQSLI